VPKISGRKIKLTHYPKSLSATQGPRSGHIPEKRLPGFAPPVALEVFVYLFAEAVIVALPDRSRVMTFTIHTAVLSPCCREW
jgi:hypothetical protein